MARKSKFLILNSMVGISEKLQVKLKNQMKVIPHFQSHHLLSYFRKHDPAERFYHALKDS